MKTEFEAKFVNIHPNVLRSKLKGLGATQIQPMRVMRRAIADTPELKARDAFIRVRDEGDKVTLTYKQFNELSVDGAKEYEVIVNDFQTTVDLLKAAGLPYRTLQESKREEWSYDEAEVVIDEWPWLEPYVEIEGYSEAHVQNVAEKLGFSWGDAVFGDVMAAYRKQYPHLSAQDTIGDIAEVKFGGPLPELLKG